MRRAILAVAVALLVVPCLAEAKVTRLEITTREPFADGQAFGTSGAYEKVVGRFHGELDPAHPLNAVIVDLDRAPRNARGAVEYSADFYILKPVDLGRGNGAVLYDVNNRGSKRALRQFNSAEPSDDPSTAAHAGNGFLMREGFTVAWSGWLPDAPHHPHALRLQVTVARQNGSPIEALVWDEFMFNNSTTTLGRLSFRPASADAGRATLLVRERNDLPASLVPAAQWEFAGERTIRLLPAGTPFRAGAIYQLVYRAVDPPVAGIGFAATRDFVSFLRHGTDAGGVANPLAPGGTPAIRRAIAHGTSQSGRYLRDFLYRGFNEDEAARRVFDGINPHITTARLFLNYRFAQPERSSQGGHGGLFYPDITFPFGYETMRDPLSGRTDGLLARCTARGNCPKVVHTISSNEYWNAAHSLVTTDPLGQRDAGIPDSVRIYLVNGTQHLAGRGDSMPKGVCALPPNPVDARPVLRFAIRALDAWVKDGTAPPPSRYPRIADGSLVRMADFRFPRIPGVVLPAAPAARPRLDYGPDYERGIITRVPPEPTGATYTVLVPRVDDDGNEIGGLRLPAITVPTGTATGWATRTAEGGSAGALCGLDGSFVPFAATKSERDARGDPRPSFEERYRDRDGYVARVRAEAAALRAAGYLLDEDAQRIVDAAR